jgi:DNA-binding Xre family transcriptional regulator
MTVCYDKLFHLLIDKKITNAQLMQRAGLSGNIITRLKREGYISLESVESICRALECGVDDILEFLPDTLDAEFSGKDRKTWQQNK